ncbi:Protein CASC1 [Bagarius yarrelli]|uniref:Dynein axonemal intermediate chain 7 n=1 Tax=Bagarius yarrelli TaxID=175774 RepID=A0A556V3C6_BAGYA|nr:Protein CASC1 [Bagarius yarrelli]
MYIQPPKKKGKSSKAEKKRLKKEEEERRLREEEEARLLAEQEEQERLEREQQEEEKQRRLELKDRERRGNELNELHLMMMENQKKVDLWEATARKEAEWNRYMICDGSPNPAVQTEINAFITLWKEDPNVDIQTILQQCALALPLTDELEVVLKEETDPDIIQVHQDTLKKLQKLIHSKHLKGAEKILKSARVCADIETGNMHLTVCDDNVNLCLWANISKNPRFKDYDFQEVGLSFELPKQLAMSDISVRILYTRYDHLSPLSLQKQAQNKHPVTEKEECEANVEPLSEILKDLEDGETKGEDEERESTQPEQDDVQSLKSVEGNKSKVSVHSSKEERKSSSLKLHEEKEDHSENIKEEEITSGDPEGVPVTELDPTDHHIVDMYRYMSLGGVYYFDLFQLPPQSITINNWELTEILDTGLQHFPYPLEQPNISVTGNTEDSGMQSNPPVKVTVVLPESVIFLQEPQVVRWDPVGQHWRTDGIVETSYDSETRSVSVKMESFYTFTMLQETYANMPFQNWELRPQGHDSVMLSITTALTEVRFNIQENQCMLELEQAPELNHILGKWMSLPALQTAMRHAGVNVFVGEYSEDYVTVSAKVCEHLEEGPVPQEAWSLYLLGAQRGQRLKIKETSKDFSAELADNTEFHSSFLHMLRDFISPEGRDRIDNAHYLLVNTLQRLLCATRVLAFS